MVKQRIPVAIKFFSTFRLDTFDQFGTECLHHPNKFIVGVKPKFLGKRSSAKRDLPLLFKCMKLCLWRISSFGDKKYFLVTTFQANRLLRHYLSVADPGFPREEADYLGEGVETYIVEHPPQVSINNFE